MNSAARYEPGGADTRVLRIGTRGSPLALLQARETRARLMQTHGLPEEAFAIEVIATSGDRIQDRPLSEAGGKGLFTKEIEEALLSGRIDLAVHSSKDMPTRLPDGLELSAFLPREDARDAFVGHLAATIAEMPRGALVGSSSLRRQALIKRLRPDLVVGMFRGNVDTRLRKLREGQAGGTVLALAGLKRLGVAEVATDVMALDAFPPAPGQGAICIETRIGDEATLRMVAAIHHAETGAALACERAFLDALDGSCRTPIAGYAEIADGALRFAGMVLSLDGSKTFEESQAGSPGDAAALGRAAGDSIKARAGRTFLDGWA